MKNRSDFAAPALIVACIACAAIVGTCDAQGQDRVVRASDAAGGRRREPAEVSIARFLCGEADARKTSAAPLLWTMKRRADAHGMQLVPMLSAYSAPLRGHGGRRGAWVRALPAAFPTPGYRRRNWPDAIDAARSFIAGTLPDPCQRPTFHFGSAADMRARFPRAVPVACGDGADDSNIYITEDGT